MTKPVTVDVSFKNYRPVEILGYLNSIQRVDAHTARLVAKDMIEASKFLEFVTSYDPAITP